MKHLKYAASALAVAVVAWSPLAHAKPVQPQASHGGDAFAVPAVAPDLDTQPLFRGPGKDEHLGRPGHPPLDQIPAMPLWDLGNQPNLGAGMGVPILHDGLTREATEFPLYPSAGVASERSPGYVAPDAVAGAPEFDFTNAFGTLTQVTNVGTDPFRRNVKVVMRFVDTGGVDRFFVCSGTMADPETVLTAGHCVYAHSPSGFTINDWAEEFWVYPGWDGNGPTGDNTAIIQTHGIGYGTFAGAFTGWTVDQNNDWDLGLIRINRAVGSLTGWFGWAWGGGCSNIQNRTYYLYSYPAENCGGGLHNGRDMYRWSGSYDSCPGNQLEIDTTPGCFTEQHGGMSGGGSYYLENGTRYVHAVVSNSLVNGERAWHTKIWENFKDFMLDFENDSRGSVLDLQLLRARYLESSVTAGQTITGDGYVLANPTNANPASTSYNVEHFLSTNAIISTLDTRLAGENVTWDFGPVSTVNVNNGSYTIPKNTPSGSYFVGARVSNSDANNSNNDGSYWDAQQITVNGVADLAAVSVSRPGAAFTGEPFNVTFSYENQGGDPSNTVTVELRMSTNSIISGADVLLDTFVYSGLSGDASSTRTVSVTIPQPYVSGAYYLGIIVDSSDDTSSSNNTVASTSSFVLDARSDLEVSNVNAIDGAYAPGDDLGLSLSINNAGVGASGSYTVSVYASTNTIISSFDTLLDTYNAPSLAAGASFSPNLLATVPAGLAPGDYYIGVILSDGDAEIDTADNTGLDLTPITVVASCPGDATGDGFVNADDLLVVLGNFGSAVQGGPADGDFDDSGAVNADDLLTVLGAFGTACP